MKLLDLFAGIGGFSYAAHQLGWQTIAFVEKDEFCQKVLRKNFGKDIEIYDDITNFSAESFRGRCDVLTAGFPCQPHSIAGKGQGKSDERYLFPQVVRVISEVKPKWIVLENVRRLSSQSNGELFEEICSSVESEGYEIQPFIIPACAVNAPHERFRLWLIAHSNGFGCCDEQKERKQVIQNEIGQLSASELERSFEQCGALEYDSNASYAYSVRKLQQKRIEQNFGRRIGDGDNSIITDSESPEREFTGHSRKRRSGFTDRNFVTSDTERRRQPTQRELGRCFCAKTSSKGQANFAFDENQFKGNWLEIAAELCRENDGISAELDGTGRIPAKSKNKKAAGRQHRLRALGNSIVPQIAFEIFKAIEQAEKLQT